MKWLLKAFNVAISIKLHNRAQEITYWDVYRLCIHIGYHRNQENKGILMSLHTHHSNKNRQQNFHRFRIHRGCLCNRVDRCMSWEHCNEMFRYNKAWGDHHSCKN